MSGEVSETGFVRFRKTAQRELKPSDSCGKVGGPGISNPGADFGARSAMWVIFLQKRNRTECVLRDRPTVQKPFASLRKKSVMGGLGGLWRKLNLILVQSYVLNGVQQKNKLVCIKKRSGDSMERVEIVDIECQLEKMKRLNKQFFAISKSLTEKRREIKKRIKELNKQLGREVEKKSPQLRLFDL